MPQDKALVTGATGCLGRNVVSALLDQDADVEVIATSRTLPDPLPKHRRLRWVSCDLSDAEACRRLLVAEKPESILHLAANGVRPPRPSAEALRAANVDSTLRLFEYSNGWPCHFVFASSALVYRPLSRPLRESDALGTQHDYGASKLAAEIALRQAAVQSGRSLTIVRPFPFSGPHERPGGLIDRMLDAASKRIPLPMTSGLQVRDFCAVADIAAGFVACWRHRSGPRVNVYNLGSGRGVSLRHLVEDLREQLGLELDVTWGALTPGPGDVRSLIADISKAKQVLGWQPHSSFVEAVGELATQNYPLLSLLPRRTVHVARSA